MKHNLWAPVMLPMLPSVAQILDTLLALISGLTHRRCRILSISKPALNGTGLPVTSPGAQGSSYHPQVSKLLLGRLGGHRTPHSQWDL